MDTGQPQQMHLRLGVVCSTVASALHPPGGLKHAGQRVCAAVLAVRVGGEGDVWGGAGDSQGARRAGPVAAGVGRARGRGWAVSPGMSRVGGAGRQHDPVSSRSVVAAKAPVASSTCKVAPFFACAGRRPVQLRIIPSCILSSAAERAACEAGGLKRIVQASAHRTSAPHGRLAAPALSQACKA